MLNEPIGKIPKKARIALIVAAVIPLGIIAILGGWVLTHQDMIRQQQMYLAVGEAVIKNWNNLSETTRSEIESACNPVNMARGWLRQEER